MFLYVLSIPRYKAIKIGIATNHNRIKQHLNTYKEINLKESYIIKAKLNSTIKQLEKQLLEDYCDFKIDNEELKNRDGYTELRNINILNNVIEDIKYKSKRFEDKGIEIAKGIKTKKSLVKKNNNKLNEETDAIIKDYNLNNINKFCNYVTKYSAFIVSYKYFYNQISNIIFKIPKNKFKEIEMISFKLPTGGCSLTTTISTKEEDDFIIEKIKLYYDNDDVRVKEYYRNIDVFLRESLENKKVI